MSIVDPFTVSVAADGQGVLCSNPPLIPVQTNSQVANSICTPPDDDKSRSSHPSREEGEDSQ